MEKLFTCKSKVLSELTYDLLSVDKGYINKINMLADFLHSYQLNDPIPAEIKNLKIRFWKEYYLLCIEYFGADFGINERMENWLKTEQANIKPLDLKKCWEDIITDRCINESLKYLDIALEQYQKSEFTNAKKSIDMALQFTPNWKHLSVFKAELNLETGDFQQAWDELNLITDPEHQNYYFYFVRGECHLAFSNFTEALVDYNKSIKLDTTYPCSFSSRSIIKKTLGDYDGSMEDISKAIELNPNNANNYELRSDIWRVKGLYNNAFDDLAAAYLLDPSEERFYEDLSSLAMITGRLDEFEIIKGKAELKIKQELKKSKPIEYNELFPEKMSFKNEDEMFVSQLKEFLKQLNVIMH